MVHDVTEAQTEIRAAAPYAMIGDAVIAALPAWRARLEAMAAKAPGKPLSRSSCLSPVARPSKLVAAPTNYKAHIEEMAARAATQNIKPSPAIGTAGLFLKANSSLVGPSEGIAIRFPERRNEHEVELVIIFGKAGQRHPAGQGARLRRRLLHRSRHDGARTGGPQFSQIDRQLFRARTVDGHRRRDRRSRRRAAQSRSTARSSRAAIPSSSSTIAAS